MWSHRSHGNQFTETSELSRRLAPACGWDATFSGVARMSSSAILPCPRTLACDESCTTRGVRRGWSVPLRVVGVAVADSIARDQAADLGKRRDARRGEPGEVVAPMVEVRLQVARLPPDARGDLGQDAPGEVLERPACRCPTWRARPGRGAADGRARRDGGGGRSGRRRPADRRVAPSTDRPPRPRRASSSPSTSTQPRNESSSSESPSGGSAPSVSRSAWSESARATPPARSPRTRPRAERRPERGRQTGGVDPVRARCPVGGTRACLAGRPRPRRSRRAPAARRRPAGCGPRGGPRPGPRVLRRGPRAAPVRRSTAARRAQAAPAAGVQVRAVPSDASVADPVAVSPIVR